MAKKIVGVSVKARISKSHERFAPTIPIGSEKIEASRQNWGVNAYVGVVVGNKDGDFDAFIFPHKDLKKLKGGAVRKDVVAVSELLKNPTKKTIKLF